MKRIIVRVSPAGEVSITTKGYAGKGCKDASRFIEEALGEKTGETLTSEYHQRPTNGTQNNQTA